MRLMNANKSFLSVALALGLLGAGCSSSSDYIPQSNTGRGAAVGAATGAVLGGVIGHQSGDTTKGAVLGGVVGGVAGAAIGNQRDRRAENDAAIYSSQDVAGGYVVQNPPPTPTSQPYETVPPRPSNNSVWLAGHYAFNGSSYDWVPGRWEIPPAGATRWMPPAWQPQGTGYVYVRGHWE